MVQSPFELIGAAGMYVVVETSRADLAVLHGNI
jgi:hypothetical protein